MPDSLSEQRQSTHHQNERVFISIHLTFHIILMHSQPCYAAVVVVVLLSVAAKKKVSRLH
jgi:hypothetical protein